MAEPAGISTKSSDAAPSDEGLVPVASESPVVAVGPAEPQAAESIQRPWDHEKFKNVAAGIQSIVVAIGLIAGGIWTTATFSILGQAEKAKAELHDLNRGPIINTSISAKVASERRIIVEVRASNTGSAPFTFDVYTNTRFYLAKVDSVQSDGKVHYGPRIPLLFHYQDKLMSGTILVPGATESVLQAVQQAPEAGVYLVRFAVQAKDGTEGREDSSQVFIDVL